MFSIRRICVTGLTAAVYAALTLSLPMLSYGQIQCRFSEVLNLLVFINPIFAPGIVLGCFIANLFSDLPFDWLFGTLATLGSVLFIAKFSKNLFIASLWPVLFNAVIIGAELCIAFGIPFNLFGAGVVFAEVMIGEFVAVVVIGYPLFTYLMKNRRFIEILKGL